MQPYQKATEEIKRHSSLPEKAIKTGIGTALSVAGGSAILSRLAPFLNKFVPADIAIKGISKLSSTLGSFIKEAQKKGYPEEEIISFVQEKSEQEKASEEAKLESLRRAKEAKKKGSGKESFVEKELARVQGQYGQMAQNPESQAALQPQQQQPQQGDAMQKLMQALQMAAQARQRRQQ